MHLDVKKIKWNGLLKKKKKEKRKSNDKKKKKKDQDNVPSFLKEKKKRKKRFKRRKTIPDGEIHFPVPLSYHQSYNHSSTPAPLQ